MWSEVGEDWAIWGQKTGIVEAGMSWDDFRHVLSTFLHCFDMFSVQWPRFLALFEL